MTLDNLIGLNRCPIPLHGITVGNFRLETDDSRIVSYAEYRGDSLVRAEETRLDPKGYEIMLAFFMNPGMTLSPSQAFNYYHPEWKHPESDTLALRVYFSTMRRNFPLLGEAISNVWGRGYVLELPKSKDEPQSPLAEYFPEYSITYGSVSVNLLKQTAFNEDQELQVSQGIYKILTKLVGAQGKIVTNEQLLKILGLPNDRPARNSLRDHVSRARKVVGKGIIKNINGSGFLLESME